MKYLIMKFRMENAIRLFECRILTRAPFKYKDDLTVEDFQEYGKKLKEVEE